MTLIYDDMYGAWQFNSNNSNYYKNSTALQMAIGEIIPYSVAEKDAILRRTLTSGTYSGETTDGIAGPEAENTILWQLSTAEAFMLDDSLRVAYRYNGSANKWWLSSPGSSSSVAAYVDEAGEVIYEGMDVATYLYLRYACNLDLSSVILASPATGGKPGSTVGSSSLILLPDAPMSTDIDWKLTLYDSSRSNFAVKEMTLTSEKATISYSNAKVGANEYISAIIVDNGKVVYYGRIYNVDATSNDGMEIDIPQGVTLDSDTQLYVFNEQVNAN
ncbi:MAG: hypothetical protein VB071_04885, partial [Lawsonibacter sp.]|nr:hypothetical protein [Lawsonibacter sp.]